ncbi:hypothetical protein DICPUDRAFT_35246 [Dictyostelium purpureum]|uniref:Cathepsin propeptide inhibitor domain-containing protein n=1 Tax=Dictyostelium purpureum TaxID=5786 RepID=F0ZP36_DICPU|nr:uncharacterized protein DICPUDRAFT_35246 [Dictyostelium purpureum]EGC34302.1 hypothetical protein DICPUDRAFT_35246 [Dictyostelium purpureum]|eukprot:XP_003289184.1 hypothetical protein DICPUDRAFT_35246 [Dictyostelium purpureum]
MNIKYTLVLVICAFLVSGLVDTSRGECSCSGSNKMNINDPSVITDKMVKIYGHWDFEGSQYLYNETDGYVQLPDEFRNNVQSFQSGIDVCFIKWYPKEQYQIKAGEYHKNYAALNNFGQRMDGLYAGTCSDTICKQ